MMAKFIIIFTIIILLFLISCQQDLSIKPTNNLEYVRGELIVGITNSTEIKIVFHLMNDLQLELDQLNGFYYNSTWPKDSVKYLIQYFSLIPYINTRGFGPTTSNIYYYETDNKIRVLLHLFEMNKKNQTDWLERLDELELIDRNGSTKNMLIKVPEGEELYWLAELKKYEIVKWTALNQIGGIVPH